MARAPEAQLKHDLASIQADVAALTEAVESLVSEGARVQAAMAKAARRSIKNAGNAGADIIDNTWNLGEDSAAAVSNAAQAGVAMIESQVKKNPLGLALVALGVGFIVGLLRFK
jgi:ElaB/YqjD/DUF883 family membrane-anchored ribosome-binding protein